MKKLLLVNKKDQIIGCETKEKCHQGKGILHRAFSVYLVDEKGRLLIQQRSKFKKLWPLYWANSCCGHPYKGEEYEEAGERRLKEELGFSVFLRFVDKFYYHIHYKNIGSENEICGILAGRYSGEKIQANPKEVADWKFVEIDKLKKDFRKNSDKYAPWFKIGLKKYLEAEKNRTKKRKELKLFLKKTAKKIDLIAKGFLKKDTDSKFYKLIDYQYSTGGKRLRPALAIISSNLLGGKLNNVLYPAAGLEILHNCTLIADDIVDHSQLRRGKPTTWHKFGKSIAEWVSLGYLASAFKSIKYSKETIVKLEEIFAKILKTIMSGEFYDILFEQKGREDEPYVKTNRYIEIKKRDYYKMAAEKTAFLFQSCCEVGGICSGASKQQLEHLKNYGFNLGMAFQIRDDILDIFGEEKKFGKKIGKDIEERKLGNIVVLLAMQELPKEKKEKILKVFKKRKIEDKDIKKVIEIIKTTNSRQQAEKLACNFLKKAKGNLKFLPQNKWNQLLEVFADFVVQREE